MRLLKGHGTENDFLLLPDFDGTVTLEPAVVRALCDRRSGLGADGVLRVVRSANEPAADDFADRAEWFMDYRNADGSLAEMCGNGMRVFVRYLWGLSLVEQNAAVATRGGVRRVRVSGGGDVTVQMGLPRILADRPIATAALTNGAELTGPGVALELPNPHVVVPVSDDTLLALDLARPPRIDPPLPHGQNVEFVVRRGPRHLALRVHERGVGETRSCGTGICAAVVATAEADGAGADGTGWLVDVPGGRCAVTWRTDGEVELTGPAVLLAEIEADDAWLARAASGAIATEPAVATPG